MGVMGGNCCGLARYQTVITLGEPDAKYAKYTQYAGTTHFQIQLTDSKLCFSGIGLIVADAALFMINIGNTWTQ